MPTRPQLLHADCVAGVTGMLLASAAVKEGMCAPVMHLRNLNPHVAAALKDWARHGGPAAAVPRQPSGAANFPNLNYLPSDD